MIYFTIAALFFLINLYSEQNHREAVLTYYGGQPLMYVIQNRQLTVYSDTLVGENYLKSIFRSRKIDSFRQEKFPTFFEIGGKRYFLLNGSYPDSLFFDKPDVIILSASPKVNMDLWIARSGAKILIPMQNNFIFIKELWKKSAGRGQLEYIDIQQYGYLTLSKND